jgi:hypothetical protein
MGGTVRGPKGEEARVLGEEARRRPSGHGFSTEGREERGMSRSEFPRWGNERADEFQPRALPGVNRDRTHRVMLTAILGGTAERLLTQASVPFIVSDCD